MLLKSVDKPVENHVDNFWIFTPPWVEKRKVWKIEKFSRPF